MARIGIFFGLVLCGLTVAALSVTTEKSYTQFVPMMFGIPLLFLGVVGLNPHRRMNATFVAMTLGLLGTVLGGIRLVILLFDRAAGEFVNPISLRLVTAMTFTCLSFALVALVWVRKRAERRRAKVALTTKNDVAGERPEQEPLAIPTAAASVDPAEPSTRPNASPANPYQSPRPIEKSTENH